MDAKTVLRDLKNIKKGTMKGKPKWDMAPSVMSSLLYNVDASIEYLEGRLNRVFTDREEIGKFRLAFRKASRMSESKLAQVHMYLNLQWKPTQSSVARTEKVRETKEHKIYVLRAACAMIEGAGSSAMKIAEDYGLNYSVAYRLARRKVTARGYAYKDLRAMSRKERNALSADIFVQGVAEIEKFYKKYLNEEE